MANPYNRIARLRNAEDFRAYTEKLNIHLPFDETITVGPDSPLARGVVMPTRAGYF